MHYTIFGLVIVYGFKIDSVWHFHIFSIYEFSVYLSSVTHVYDVIVSLLISSNSSHIQLLGSW